MNRTILNPNDLQDPLPAGYSHTVSVTATELVFIAGQDAAGPDGVIPSADFGDQVERSFANLAVALACVPRNSGGLEPRCRA